MHKQLCTAVLLAALLGGMCLPCAAAGETKTLKAGEITVTYPSGMEDKAKEVAEFATKNILPIRDQFLKTRKALSDTDKVANRIVEWLGCPEEQKEAKKILASFPEIMDAVESLYTDIRLYRESEVKASGGMKEGAMSLSYDPSDGSFHSNWLATSDQSKEARKAFLPVAVGEDGRYNGKPVDELARGLDGTAFGMMPAIHEAAEAVLLLGLKFYHPYARWFNDGVSNWVMMQVAREFTPDLYGQCETSAMPGDEAKSLRPKINLLAWPQVDYSARNPSQEEIRLNGACYQYATEAIDRMLRDLPPDTLAKIIRKLKGQYCPNTDAICAAIKVVTDRDARAILLEYVPDRIRSDRAQNVNFALCEQAKRLVGQADYAGMARLLSTSIEIEPSDPDAHFNLAWAMRKARMPKEESERQAKIAAGLLSGKTPHDFAYFEVDDECMYILGRVLMHAGNDKKAREILEQVIEHASDPADAKAALEELDKKQVNSER